MYIQCIYKVRKTGKKTNRCQKINVKKRGNIWLQIGFNLITLMTYPKPIEKQNQSQKRESEIKQ